MPLHENHLAEKAFEIVVGSDRIVRINLDGACVLRARLGDDARVVIDDRRPGYARLTGLPDGSMMIG